MINIKNISKFEMIKYSTGDIVTSLVMNGIGTFALLYYTGAVGLSASLAGLAISITLFWEAITDPIAGYLSDNTKSKYGRRHPWMIFSIIGLSVSFYFMWVIPDFVKSSQITIFGYLVLINLLIRTFLTGYLIPFNALAYDICNDYHGRTKIQSTKQLVSMCANFFGPGLAWSLFFPHAEDVNHSANFELMGTAFAIASLVCGFVCLYFTKKYIVDSRNSIPIDTDKSHFAAFTTDTWRVFKDRNLIIIFIFGSLTMLAAVFVSTMQQYVYQYVLSFSGAEKTIVNGGTMIGAALGSLFAGYVSQKLGKVKTNYLAALICAIAGIYTSIILSTGILQKGQLITMVLFGAGNIIFWFGSAMTWPMVGSMIADTSEVNYHKTGVIQDGTFGAVYTFANKAALSIGMFVVGLALSGIGFISGASEQTHQVLNYIVLLGFFLGPAFMVFSILPLKLYKIDSKYLESIRKDKSKENGKKDYKCDSKSEIVTVK